MVAGSCLAGLLPELRHVLLWMANAVELLYFVQQRGPVYAQGLEQGPDPTGGLRGPPSRDTSVGLPACEWHRRVGSPGAWGPGTGCPVLWGVRGHRPSAASERGQERRAVQARRAPSLTRDEVRRGLCKVLRTLRGCRGGLGKGAVGCAPRPHGVSLVCLMRTSRAWAPAEQERQDRLRWDRGGSWDPRSWGRSQCGRLICPHSLSSALALPWCWGPRPVPLHHNWRAPAGVASCGGCSHEVHWGLGGDQGGRGWPRRTWASRARHSVCVSSAVSPERKKPEKQSADWPAASARPQWVHRLLPGPAPPGPPLSAGTSPVPAWPPPSNPQDPQDPDLGRCGGPCGGAGRGGGSSPGLGLGLRAPGPLPAPRVACTMAGGGLCTGAPCFWLPQGQLGPWLRLSVRGTVASWKPQFWAAGPAPRLAVRTVQGRVSFLWGSWGDGTACFAAASCLRGSWFWWGAWMRAARRMLGEGCLCAPRGPGGWREADSVLCAGGAGEPRGKIASEGEGKVRRPGPPAPAETPVGRTLSRDGLSRKVESHSHSPSVSEALTQEPSSPQAGE